MFLRLGEITQALLYTNWQLIIDRVVASRWSSEIWWTLKFWMLTEVLPFPVLKYDVEFSHQRCARKVNICWCTSDVSLARKSAGRFTSLCCSYALLSLAAATITVGINIFVSLKLFVVHCTTKILLVRLPPCEPVGFWYIQMLFHHFNKFL